MERYAHRTRADNCARVCRARIELVPPIDPISFIVTSDWAALYPAESAGSSRSITDAATWSSAGQLGVPAGKAREYTL